MKKFKLLFGIAALSVSSRAAAMPEAVPDRWYTNMISRLHKMAENGGFCKKFYYVPVCRGEL